MKSIETVEPADCHVHAVHLVTTIERVRHELGRAGDPRPPVTASGASPRECWFAALAVHRRCARLDVEWGGDAATPLAHPPPVDQIRPGHVLQVIEAAATHLHGALRALGGNPTADPPARDKSRTPSDVLGTLVTAGRQLDRLLAAPLSPGDVYQQVAIATAYAARLPGAPTLVVPALARGKAPADCYAELSAALEATRAMSTRAGHPVIAAAPAGGERGHVVPGDCFDLATLVVGELAFLHALHNDDNPPAPYEVPAVGRKLPAHVFQLAAALRVQLEQLAR